MELDMSTELKLQPGSPIQQPCSPAIPINNHQGRSEIQSIKESPSTALQAQTIIKMADAALTDYDSWNSAKVSHVMG
ncbi:TPA: hypothetical protein ACH3X2_013113 [Trebouxia sp. C0005]